MTEQQGPDGAGRDDSDAGLSDTETQVQQEANELLEKAESKWEKLFKQVEVVREQLSSARSRRVQAAGDEVGRVDLEITFLRRRAAALNEATKLLDKRTDEAVAAQRASEQAEEEQ